MSKFKEIALEKLFESSSNPRRHYSEESLQELADSIRDIGVLEPIVVRPVTKSENGQEIMAFEIVCGSRRFRASKIAGIDKMPAMIKDCNEEEAFFMQISENLHRDEISPLDEAMAYKSLVDKNFDLKEISAYVAKSIQYITSRLQLVQLDEQVMAEVWNGKMSLQIAQVISRLQPDDQLKVLEQAKTEDNEGNYFFDSAEDVKDFVASHILCNLSTVAWSKDDETIYPEAGPCKTCPKRSGFNKSLFNDIEEVDRCFDPKCFNKKTNNFMAWQMAVLKDAGQKEIELITTGWSNKATIQSQNYKMARGGQWQHCKSEEMAIIIESNNNNGAIVPICKDKKCPVHWSAPIFSKTLEPEETARKEKYQACLLVLDAILENDMVKEDFISMLGDIFLWQKFDYNMAKTMLQMYLLEEGETLSEDRDNLGLFIERFWKLHPAKVVEFKIEQTRYLFNKFSNEYSGTMIDFVLEFGKAIGITAEVEKLPKTPKKKAKKAAFVDTNGDNVEEDEKEAHHV